MNVLLQSSSAVANLTDGCLTSTETRWCSLWNILETAMLFSIYDSGEQCGVQTLADDCRNITPVIQPGYRV